MQRPIQPTIRAWQRAAHRFGCALLFVGTACQKTPAHLLVESRPQTPFTAPPTTATDLVAQLVWGDPLVRRPDAHTEGWWLAAPDGGPVAAWSTAVLAPDIGAEALHELEAHWPGTPAVALARGARLARLEQAMPTSDPPPEGDRALVAWLGPLATGESSGPSDVRPPLAWLGDENGRGALLHALERSVLLGWLDGPEIPLGPVEAAMTAGTFDRLRDAPTGRLLVARAQDLHDEGARAQGADRLVAATALALTRAAADHPGEHARAASDAAEWATQLSLPEGTDPLPVLLDQAASALTADAGDPTSTGLALVALTAARFSTRCTDTPCRSLDRTATLQRASAWGPPVEAFAWTWRVIAAKTVLDQLAIAVERGRGTDVHYDVADILIGERGARVPLSLLRQNSINEVAALHITRAADAANSTAGEDAVHAMQQVLASICARPPTDIPPPLAPGIQKVCKPPRQ